MRSRRAGVACRIERVTTELLGVALPVGLTAWDGSTAGPPGTPRVVLRRRRALRHILWSPGVLGMARAFVSGDLEVQGDLTEGLRRCWALARQQRLRGLRFGPRQWRRLAGVAASLGVLGPRPEPPKSEARLSGALHSRSRDRSAIAHHYDAGNRFYELLLDPRMAYSCGYWTSEAAGYTLADAQEDKLELICRKLNLAEGDRLLDVGCGWGSLILYAAQRYDVHATGVTLSQQQADHVRRRIEQLGLRARVEVRLQDYRELDDRPYDAIASIEMGEHVGKRNYPTYVASLHRVLRPHGRLLLQQMSRGATAPGGGAFIESYIAPDMNMVPVGRTLDHLEYAGFETREVRAMREHYVPTVRSWAQTLEKSWDEVVGLVGAEQARVWRLYLAGGALAFEENRMGVNQILSVRPGDDVGCVRGFE
ncbi:cyclopropane-fatty-acyl-phospholipid synthase [Haloactinomyces albus]|uniref:Cyclopropane-fatty-acyl-phospholipid synthase n=1 Tax=Haloactinomyces albus TaxID=1352928 RepID=A0AAE3Z9H5_9ACTN|nr:cyclopropane-fatty-acyl-phospholipid synthase family protein [Haloactinomyces albus]MDR7300797.1 cyclopropane-fatty-acyl-phospholipid synthase [Haloactinomyces albus]